MKKLLLSMLLIATPSLYAMEYSENNFAFEEPEPKKQNEKCVFYNPDFNTIEGRLLVYQSRSSKTRFMIIVIKNLSSHNFTDYSAADLCSEKERIRHEKEYDTHVATLKNHILDFEKTFNLEHPPAHLTISS